MSKKAMIFLVSVLLALVAAAYFFGIPLWVQQVHTHTNNSASNEQLQIVRGLFVKNNIPLDGLVITRIAIENGRTHMFATQVYETLPAFSDQLSYHFDPEGKPSISENGNPYIGDKIETVNVSLKPTISALTAAYKLVPKIPGRFLSAELGLYDLNSGVSYAPQNFALVWLIKPVGDDYPYAYVNAADGKTIYYDDGIRY